jgi:hypothetical protein
MIAALFRIRGQLIDHWIDLKSYHSRISDPISHARSWVLPNTIHLLHDLTWPITCCTTGLASNLPIRNPANILAGCPSLLGALCPKASGNLLPPHIRHSGSAAGNQAGPPRHLATEAHCQGEPLILKIIGGTFAPRIRGRRGEVSTRKDASCNRKLKSGGPVSACIIQPGNCLARTSGLQVVAVACVKTGTRGTFTIARPKGQRRWEY